MLLSKVDPKLEEKMILFFLLGSFIVEKERRCGEWTGPRIYPEAQLFARARETVSTLRAKRVVGYMYLFPVCPSMIKGPGDVIVGRWARQFFFLFIPNDEMRKTS